MIPEGTPVVVEIADAVGSEGAKKGDTVSIRAVEAVNVDQFEVIEAGAPGIARVIAVEKAGLFGKSGTVGITLEEIQLTDGNWALLQGNIAAKGSAIRSGIVGPGLDLFTILFDVAIPSIITPILLALPGTSAEIPAGASVQGVTSETTSIETGPGLSGILDSLFGVPSNQDMPSA